MPAFLWPDIWEVFIRGVGPVESEQGSAAPVDVVLLRAASEVGEIFPGGRKPGAESQARKLEVLVPAIELAAYLDRAVGKHFI